GMGMSAVGAETEVAWLHGDRKACRDGLLSERQVASAFDQVLQEQVEGALLRLPDGDLGLVKAKAQLFADVVVQTVAACRGCGRGGWFPRHSLNPGARGTRKIGIRDRPGGYRA